MGGLLGLHWYKEEGPGWVAALPSPLLAVPNVTAHPSTGVALWMSSNRLQLNAEKTEFMWCVPPRRRHHLPTDS